MEENDAKTRQPLAVRGPTDSSSISSVGTGNTQPVSSPGSPPSKRLWGWPSVFTVPHFSYDAELQLEKANAEYRASGIHLSPSPKLKSQALNSKPTQMTVI